MGLPLRLTQELQLIQNVAAQVLMRTSLYRAHPSCNSRAALASSGAPDPHIFGTTSPGIPPELLW